MLKLLLTLFLIGSPVFAEEPYWLQDTDLLKNDDLTTLKGSPDFNPEYLPKIFVNCPEVFAFPNFLYICNEECTLHLGRATAGERVVILQNENGIVTIKPPKGVLIEGQDKLQTNHIDNQFELEFDGQEWKIVRLKGVVGF